MATFTGVLVQAGWVGIYNGAADLTMSGGQSNGAPILQSWNSNFDSAFNLQLSDPIPSGLTFTSASTGQCRQDLSLQERAIHIPGREK